MTYIMVEYSYHCSRIIYNKTVNSAIGSWFATWVCKKGGNAKQGAELRAPCLQTLFEYLTIEAETITNVAI